ncbi:MAG: hypothetical protein F6K11_31785 [Leptolyngbya sp. SIO3F4]|nr:hypothetical protein [Leptolyngbya sp. SIO3F4]
MSPAVLIFLPLTLLLLMSKGAGANTVTPTPKKTTSGKVMGVVTEDGDFIQLPSLIERNDDNSGVVIEQNGKRYLIASVRNQD